MVRVKLSVDPGDGAGPIDCTVDYPSLSFGPLMPPMVPAVAREALKKALTPDRLRGALLRMLATEVAIVLGTRFTRR